MTAVLFVLLLAGAVASSYGWFLRSRRIQAEHWLWKKKRLRLANLLTASGAVASTLSFAALMLPGTPV